MGMWWRWEVGEEMVMGEGGEGRVVMAGQMVAGVAVELAGGSSAAEAVVAAVVAAAVEVGVRWWIMSEQLRAREACRDWWKMRRWWAVRCPVPPLRYSVVKAMWKRESSHEHAEGGPMPPRVVKTMGRKARSSSTQPARCLSFFSFSLAANRWAAEVAAAVT